jgi:hypothetical protein
VSGNLYLSRLLRLSCPEKTSRPAWKPTATQGSVEIQGSYSALAAGASMFQMS